MYRGRVDIYKAERRRRNPVTTRCYICDEAILCKRNEFGGRFEFGGKQHSICERCRGRYWRPVEQARQFGKRFPFIERHEVFPKFEWGATFTTMFHILKLAHERQKIRQKEVNWMVEDQAKLRIKLPDRIATILGKTFAVRGDDATMSDDEALIRIRDLLEAIDETIIDRNKNKRLP